MRGTVLETKRDRVIRNLNTIDSAPPLNRMNGMGFGLYGWMHDPAIPGKFVKIYFFTFLWLPIIPLCAYCVSKEGHGYRFYHSLTITELIVLFRWKIFTLYISALIEGCAVMALFICALGVMYGIMNFFHGL